MADKVTTTIFRSNKTQAVRLPKAVAFPGDVSEVEVIAIGSSRLICPVGHRWDTFFGRQTTVSGDFLADRDQGSEENREPLQMLRYMLDTNTCVYALKADATSRIAGHFNRHAEQLCISSIVLAELQYGAENSQRVPENLRQIELFAARLEAILDFDSLAAVEHGRVRSSLRHQPIGPLDTLIAAHALSRRLILVTGNVAEFARVPGLEIETWQ